VMAADEDTGRAAAKRELLRERASRRLQAGEWPGADAGWDAAFFAEPVPVVLGQPMVEDLSINPYPFYSFDATAGQQFHIGVNDISVEDTGLWIYGTDRTTLLYDYDQDNCGAFEGTVCSESVDCPPDSPLCGGYAEEAEFTAPADGTYYAMGHSLSVGGDYGWTSGFTEPTELSLTVRDTWPGGPTPPPPPVVACVGAWSDWSACSEPCGPAGVRQRAYVVSTAAAGGGATCPAAAGDAQSEGCNVGISCCQVGIAPPRSAGCIIERFLLNEPARFDAAHEFLAKAVQDEGDSLGSRLFQ
jgi:hypothetical protein